MNQIDLADLTEGDELSPDETPECCGTSTNETTTGSGTTFKCSSCGAHAKADDTLTITDIRL
jgi:tRNA(Ile2) C34 agmatinyltransferase TiaS